MDLKFTNDLISVQDLIQYEESFLGYYAEEKNYKHDTNNKNNNSLPWSKLRHHQLPYQPMLARPVDNIETISKYIAKYGTKYMIEHKYDGERI